MLNSSPWRTMAEAKVMVGIFEQVGWVLIQKKMGGEIVNFMKKEYEPPPNTRKHGTKWKPVYIRKEGG